LGIRADAMSTTFSVRGRSAAIVLTSRVNSDSGSSTPACGAPAARRRRSNSSRLTSEIALDFALLIKYLAGLRVPSTPAGP
jgi:hypothetical protein